jgi:hypothetical protein
MTRINDEEVPTVLTSKTENATNINPNDASTTDQREKFQRLSKYNRGIWNGPRRENKEITRHQDNLAIFDALAGQLDLTEYQKEKGRRTLTQLDLPKIGKPVHLIAFSICILVANDDVHDDHRYWPTAKNNDECFERVADGLEYGDNTILSGMMTVDARREEAGDNDD